MTETNKEEVKRALHLAKSFFEAGKYEKCEKLLQKALKMDPDSIEVQTMIENVNFAKKSASKSGHVNKSGTKNDSSRDAPDNSSKRSYTADQLRGVQQITQAKSLYEILNVERNSSQADIKKSYRKLALKFHPDKNAAPGADEAFKLINKAFSVLSDENKKADYDRYGERAVDGSAPAGHGAGFHRHPFAGDDFDPDEIFRQFFGPQFFGSGGPRVYTFGGGRGFQFGGRPMGERRQQNSNNEPEGFGMSSLLQLLPIILLFLLSVLSFPEQTTSMYSLYQTPVYSVKQTTSIKGLCPDLVYFTRPEFDRIQKRDRQQFQEVEKSVQQSHLKYAEDRCIKERRLSKRKGKQLAKNDEKFEWCEKLEYIRSFL